MTVGGQREGGEGARRAKRAQGWRRGRGDGGGGGNGGGGMGDRGWARSVVAVVGLSPPTYPPPWKGGGMTWGKEARGVRRAGFLPAQE